MLLRACVLLPQFRALKPAPYKLPSAGNQFEEALLFWCVAKIGGRGFTDVGRSERNERLAASDSRASKVGRPANENLVAALILCCADC